MVAWWCLTQVRNYDLNGVSHFLNSFEFSSQKWVDFYKWQDEQYQKQTQVCFTGDSLISRSSKTPNPSRGSAKASKQCAISIRSVEIRCVFRGPSSKTLFSIDSFNPASIPLLLLLPRYPSRSPIQSLRSFLPWTFRPSKLF